MRGSLDTPLQIIAAAIFRYQSQSAGSAQPLPLIRPTKSPARESRSVGKIQWSSDLNAHMSRTVDPAGLPRRGTSSLPACCAGDKLSFARTCGPTPSVARDHPGTEGRTPLRSLRGSERQGAERQHHFHMDSAVQNHGETEWPCSAFAALPQEAWFMRRGARGVGAGRSCCARRSAASATSACSPAPRFARCSRKS